MSQAGKALSSSATMCALLLLAAPLESRSAPSPAQPERVAEIQRVEGEAVLALAEQASTGKPVPADFAVQWANAFLKAQRGTFIPFTLTVDSSKFSRPSVLVYVRAVRRPARPPGASRVPARRPARPSQEEEDASVVDAIFPVELLPEPGQLVRIHRGVALTPGGYDLHVVVRERVDPEAPRSQPRASVLTERLDVPDLSSGELTTSSVILADQVRVLGAPLGPDELPERPYVIGQHDITPAADRRFRRDEELIVVFLIYNPFVTSERMYDVEVEYHFFRKGGRRRGESIAGGQAGRPAARDGEQYFNHTDPQRFTPMTLGPQVDPAAGHPVMAGQGIPLAGFDAGDYRLAIRITDRLAGRSVVRDVEFTVGP